MESHPENFLSINLNNGSSNSNSSEAVNLVRNHPPLVVLSPLTQKSPQSPQPQIQSQPLLVLPQQTPITIPLSSSGKK